MDIHIGKKDGNLNVHMNFLSVLFIYRARLFFNFSSFSFSQISLWKIAFINFWLSHRGSCMKLGFNFTLHNLSCTMYILRTFQRRVISPKLPYQVNRPRNGHIRWGTKRTAKTAKRRPHFFAKAWSFFNSSDEKGPNFFKNLVETIMDWNVD